MNKSMTFSKYNGYFHDGYLRRISHKKNNIEFFLESSIINPHEISETALLSKDNKIKGVLKIKGIKRLVLNDHELHKSLKMEYDYAEILTLKTSQKEVYLLVEWDNYPPKPHTEEISEIKIEAEEIYWENIPSAEGYKFYGPASGSH